MKRTGPLWASVSVFVGVVIAILALIRGKWQLPLLLIAFGVWGIWVIFGLLLPTRRRYLAYREKDRARRTQRDFGSVDVDLPGSGTVELLLHHVNHRISDYIKSVYPKANWEWMAEDPAGLVAYGGTGRIRLYNVPGYDYADVTLDKKANLKCMLVKVANLDGGVVDLQSPPSQPNALDPQVWYEMLGRSVLEAVITDLNSRGHSELTLKEGGDICVKPDAASEDEVRDTLPQFPAKVNWPKLVTVLEQAGLSASATDTGILVSW